MTQQSNQCTRAQTLPSRKRSSGGEQNLEAIVLCNIASHAEEINVLTTDNRLSFHRLCLRKGRHAKRSRAEHDNAEGTSGWVLSLEEAFFMHHALQALTVSDDEEVLQKQVISLPACYSVKCTGHKLPLVSAASILRKGIACECIQDLWEKCRGLKVDFVESYIPYHHYRSRVIFRNLILCRACRWTNAPHASFFYLDTASLILRARWHHMTESSVLTSKTLSSRLLSSQQSSVWAGLGSATWSRLRHRLCAVRQAPV